MKLALSPDLSEQEKNVVRVKRNNFLSRNDVQDACDLHTKYLNGKLEESRLVWVALVTLKKEILQ